MVNISHTWRCSITNNSVILLLIKYHIKAFCIRKTAFQHSPALKQSLDLSFQSNVYTSTLSYHVRRTIDAAFISWQVMSEFLAVLYWTSQDKRRADTLGGLMQLSSVLSFRSGLTGGTRCAASPELRKACEAFWSVPCWAPFLLHHV